MNQSKHLFCTGLLVGVLLALGGQATADTLQITEHQITATPDQDTTPTLGHDGTSYLVVYTEFDSTGSGDIWYQRLDNDGLPSGGRVPVASGATDDTLNDVSGDYIVYTAYESTTSRSGAIKLFKISSPQTYSLGSSDELKEAKISEPLVAWRQGIATQGQVMLYDLAWLGTSTQAMLLAGPSPPTFDVEIGDRFIVWSERSAGQNDIVGYNIAGSSEFSITSTELITEIQPVTAGWWVVWQATDLDTSAVSLQAYNVDSGDSLCVADNGAYSQSPNIDGDLVAYETTLNGNYDVYVYQFSTEENYQVTSDAEHEYLNDVYDDLVAWVDTATGNGDIYVAKLSFLNVAPLSYDFGEVEVGSSAKNIVTLTNTGTGPLTIDAVVWQGGSSPDYSISLDPTPVTLNGGETADVEVTYSPSSVSDSSADLEIHFNSQEDVIVEVQLSGTGTESEPPPEEQIAVILDFFDAAVAAGTLEGDGPGRSAQGRLGALRSMILAAGDLIRDGFIEEACQQLLDAENRCDGQSPPPDFVTGTEALELMGMIQALRAELGCTP